MVSHWIIHFMRWQSLHIKPYSAQKPIPSSHKCCSKKKINSLWDMVQGNYKVSSCFGATPLQINASCYLSPLLIVRVAGRRYRALAICAHAFTSSLDFHLNPSALCTLQHLLPQEAQASIASLRICCLPEIKCWIVQLSSDTYVTLAVLLRYKLNSSRVCPVVLEST